VLSTQYPRRLQRRPQHVRSELESTIQLVRASAKDGERQGRAICAELVRNELVDQTLGHLLARSAQQQQLARQVGSVRRIGLQMACGRLLRRTVFRR
jgi:hypothetical protein